MSGVNWSEVFGWKHHKVQDGTMLASGAAAVTPTEKLAQVLPSGQWLATHGLGPLTWVEIIQIVGAVGVLIGIVKFGVGAYLAIRKKSLDELK